MAYAESRKQMLKRSKRRSVICTLSEGGERFYLSVRDAYLLGGFSEKIVKACCKGEREDFRGNKFRWATKEEISRNEG